MSVGPDATAAWRLADLPTPGPPVDAIAAITDPQERAAFIAARVAEQTGGFDLLRMGSDLVVDPVVQPGDLRTELIRRLSAAQGWSRSVGRRHHLVSPV